jgi:hypothetical protein
MYKKYATMGLAIFGAVMVVYHGGGYLKTKLSNAAG